MATWKTELEGHLGNFHEMENALEQGIFDLSGKLFGGGWINVCVLRL